MNQKSSRFDPENFLTLAESLVKINESEILEASYRTIINRSYLAVVMKASLVLEEKGEGPFPENYKFYELVEKALANRDALRSKNKLGSLREWREDADYKLGKPVKKIQADFAILTAKHALDLLESEPV